MGDLALLLGSGTTPALSSARARVEQMLEDLHHLSARLGDTAACDVAHEAGEVAAALSEPGRGVRLSTAAPLPAVDADRDLLRALLGHLMRPALASGATGAAFALSGEPAPGGRVALELADEGEEADDAQAAARLAAAGPSSGSGVVLGAGISGLAARHIVELHGGSIAARGGPRGVVVSFDLPAEGS